ncbi:MAG: TonB family protein [Leadbetterella sp.]
MLRLLFTLCVLVPLTTMSQELKKVNDKKKGEQYSVLKNNEAIKHGEYKKFSSDKTLLVRGFFKQNVPDSIWDCFRTDGQLLLKYDHRKGEVVFNDEKNQQIKKTYKIMSNGELVKANFSREPIFLYGDGFLLYEIISKLEYPTRAMARNIQGKVYVSFQLSRDGTVSDYIVKQSLDKELDQEAIRIIKLLPQAWVPGLVDNQPVDVEITIPITFKLEQ